MFGVRGHITSLKHFRPETAPDNWESNALRDFEAGVKEVSEFTKINGVAYLRLMQPMIVKKQCLKCHGHQGYKIGDIRGGVSVSVPISKYLAKQRKELINSSLSFSILWLLGFLGLTVGSQKLRLRIKERDRAKADLKKAHDELEIKVKERTIELEQAIDEIKTLKGIIPICAQCKKIRDDEGYWNNLETYIQKHSGAEFSHSICPDCAKILYPDLYLDD